MPLTLKRRLQFTSLFEVEQYLLDLNENFNALYISLSNVEHASPAKPREGMFVFADGTTWNPGSGRGLYQYTSGAWKPLGYSLIWQGTADRRIYVGTLPSATNLPAGLFNVLSDSDDTANDHIVIFVRDGGTEALVQFVHYRTSSPQSILSLVASRGTVVTPAAVQSGDLGSFGFRGNDGSGTVYFGGTAPGQTDEHGSLHFIVTETWSASARGTKAILYVTKNGTTSQFAAVEFGQDGSVVLDPNGNAFKTFYGTATPEGNVTANPGSHYMRNNSGTGEFWVKTTGTGNTGWTKVI